MANGAKYGSSVTKFAWLKKWSVFSEKYTAARTVTTMMLPSRSVRNRRARSRAPGRGARAPFADSSPARSGARAVMAQAFATPALEDVPSYRLLVVLYGPTVVLSRNFRPVFVSAMPDRLPDALYMNSCRIGMKPCR